MVWIVPLKLPLRDIELPGIINPGVEPPRFFITRIPQELETFQAALHLH